MGYLWLGTLAGIARFDGAHFTVFDNGNTPQIKASYITAFLEDHLGNLWVGTQGGGLNLFRDGRFHSSPIPDLLRNDHIGALLQDLDGGLWIGTLRGLAHFANDRLTIFSTGEGLPSNTVSALAVGRDGTIWAGTDNGLVYFKDGRLNVYTTHDGLANNTVRTLCIDRDGSLWIGTPGGLNHLKDGRIDSFGPKEGIPHVQIWSLCQDRDGSLWIGTFGSGLFRSSDGGFSHCAVREGLPGDRVTAIYQDPEGDIWVSTDGGLGQLHDPRFRVYTTQDGLVRDFTMAIYGDSSGKLWIGSVDGLSCLAAGKFSTYTSRDGVPGKNIRSICQDSSGSVCLGTYGGGVTMSKEGRFATLTARDGLSSNDVSAVCQGHSGDLWVGTSSGLDLYRDGRFTAYTTDDGLAINNIRALFEDREGSLWIGSQDAGLSRLKDGRFTNWGTKDGLGSVIVTSFYEDHLGTLWIGTLDGGISRFKDGKFATVTAKDGLYDNVAFAILPDAEDDSGDLWMSCNRGIYGVSFAELNDFADGRIRSVTSFTYGVSDGMLSRECNSASPAGWRTSDGRLWFPSTRGVVVIDPRARDLHPPRLAIEQATLDSTALPPSASIEIKPGQTDLQIQYTAISWGRPQQIRFKYQLEGLDRDWVDAGNRRTAYYTHLPPGHYIFKVIADNGEGVWNDQGATLGVNVFPPFYRAWWFAALVGLAVLAMVALIYRYRVRRLKQATAAQEDFARQLLASQESERKRIAAELHDSLGQNLMIVKNWALLGLSQADDDRAAREPLDEISAAVSQAIDEVREISHNLGPHQLERLGLTNALRQMIQRVDIASGIAFSAEIDELQGLLASQSEISLYRVVQESINNIVKHSEATQAKILIRRNAAELQVVIHDNGKGFTAAVLSTRRGFGLTGIAERVHLLGGKHEIESAVGEGTTISIVINTGEARK
jgi:ligand-binding sensor domain-containing protein/signal transduction histidine kinase